MLIEIFACWLLVPYAALVVIRPEVLPWTLRRVIRAFSVALEWSERWARYVAIRRAHKALAWQQAKEEA